MVWPALTLAFLEGWLPRVVVMHGPTSCLPCRENTFVLFYFVLHFFLFPALSLQNTQYFVTVLIQPPLERLRKRETLLRCLILLLISGPLSHLSFVFEDEVQTWL